jgi:hypothetical protein
MCEDSASADVGEMIPALSARKKKRLKMKAGRKNNGKDRREGGRGKPKQPRARARAKM